MGRVSKRLERIPGSATLAISTRAREMRAEGRDVISFGAGEPDFPTPEHIVAAAQRAATDPTTHHYSANAGLQPLREAIADYTRTHSGIPVDPGQVLVTNGAKQAIFQTFAALLDPGDEVLLPAPHWVTYPSGIDLAGGVTVSIPTAMENGFKVSVDYLERHRSDRTKLVVFVSPSNPTGSVYTADEARAIGEWAVANGIWIVTDEIYQRLVYGTEEVAPSIADVTPGPENVILVNGVAKSFAMTGWRVGWMIGPEDVIGAAARHQSHATGNVNNVAQMAALAGLTGSQDTVIAMREAFDKRRQKMVALLSATDRIELFEPHGAFYVFPSVAGLLGGRFDTDTSLAEGLLEESGVAVVPGESFGAPGHVRLSYALSDEDLERGVARMLDMFGSL
ncbi:MAG TPA: pyridoxal phosphate-dependent aminotransferase [Acidimicrobiia bacterium]|nr:pyridoxal phosphate-dependent aminotransferase [Acidimicrobiia bacterium]